MDSNASNGWRFLKDFKRSIIILGITIAICWFIVLIDKRFKSKCPACWTFSFTLVRIAKILVLFVDMIITIFSVFIHWLDTLHHDSQPNTRTLPVEQEQIFTDDQDNHDQENQGGNSNE